MFNGLLRHRCKYILEKLYWRKILLFVSCSVCFCNDIIKIMSLKSSGFSIIFNCRKITVYTTIDIDEYYKNEE